MGADFMHINLEIPTADEMRYMNEKIESFTAKEYNGLAEDWGCPGLGWPDDYSEDSEFLADAKTTIKDHVDFIHGIADDINNERMSRIPRDCSINFHGDIVVLSTGGMSWGDSPTESYDSLLAYEVLREFIGRPSDNESDYGKLVKQIGKILPNATFGEETDGQLVIYTNKQLDSKCALIEMGV